MIERYHPGHVRAFMSITAVLVVLLVAGAAGRALLRGVSPAPERSSELRIVSLSPALTRMAVDLGLRDAIIGRSSFCTDVDASLPVAGDLLNVDHERLIRLSPNLILRQAPRDADDARLHELAARYGWRVSTMRSLDGLDDIRQALEQLTQDVASVSDGAMSVEARRAVLADRMTAALQPPEGGYRGGVLLVHSIDPAGVFGRASYLGEVIEGLGAQNVAQIERWGSMSLEDIVRLDPPAVVLVRSGAVGQSLEEVFAPLLRLNLRAVRSGRLAVLSTDGAMTPSTAVIDAATELSMILRRFARSDGGEP